MDETPTLAAADVRKEYGTVTALDGVDVATEDPEVLGLAGPNGSGKTTLIRCLLGLDAPTAGETRVDGTPSGALDAGDRARLGYMPQHSAVYDDLTVRENVAFFARLYGVDDRHGAVDRALSVVDLNERADARVDALSGGMVRRTSLACALVHDPDVLFLDEPTVGLDPQLRASMWDRFRTRRDDGTTVVVSTHYLGEVDRCDRVCFLREGAVLALDTPDRLRERTGTDDMEAAFLALLAEAGGTVESDARGADGPPSRPAAGGGGRR
jgi:ABC-2 type transport system ATP-binding protein